jgi:multidrug efflux pump subunit AcrB
MPEGTTLDQTTATCDEIIARILGLEGVDTVGAMLSGGLASTLGMTQFSDDTSSVSMYVILKDGYASKSVKIGKEIEALLSDLDCEITVNSSSSMMDFSTAFGEKGVSINVYGNDLDMLSEAAAQVASVMSGVTGIESVSDGLEDATPVLIITVDKDKAMAYSLTVAQVYMAVSDALTSTSDASTLEVTDGAYDITVSDPQAAGITIEDIDQLMLTSTSVTGQETQVQLADIADISYGQSLNSITRDDQRRVLTVSGTLSDGYNVTKVTAAVKAAMADQTLPAGISVAYEGENETIMSSLSDLLKMLLLGIVIVYLIMVAQFQSLLSPFIVMFTIPLAFTGGLLALFISGFEISVVAMIGFVLLVGIIVNNGIVLIDYINQLRTEGVERIEAIITAGTTRLRPVVMTAITTILGLVPLAIGIGLGADLMQPIAVVCIGGLVYATFMTLFIVPILYDILMKKQLRVVTKDDLTIADI